jgi:hypothetical protein
VLQVAVTFAMESVLGHSPDETFQVEVMSELVVELQRLEELCSHLELPMQCSVTCSLDRCMVRPDGRTVWMPGNLGRSWLHDGKWTLSWRLCELWLCEFGTWC